MSQTDNSRDTIDKEKEGAKKDLENGERDSEKEAKRRRMKKLS